MFATYYAAQSDPALNPQFRRLWRPPDPQTRERRPLARTALDIETQEQSQISALTRHAARLLERAA
jgi:hypothetical protein